MPDEVQLIVTPASQVAVTVTTAEPPVVQLTLAPAPEVIRSFVIGPQGPAATSLTSIPDLDASDRINKSLLYYDATTARFRVDSTITATTLTDGGNY